MRVTSEEDLAAIEEIVQRHPDGIAISGIESELTSDSSRRTIQDRLKKLVESGRLRTEGKKRGVKYLPIQSEPAAPGPTHPTFEDSVPLSPAGREIREHLSKPLAARRPVGYERNFLESYRPNLDAYLTPEEREHLAKVGYINIAHQPAGTYARSILDRLLIDLSWNSSRMEGNTYSLLDTRRLINFGEEAEGKDRLEAQMIINHKEAIEFLVSGAEDIGFNRYTILNLHAVLANNLLADEAAAGRLRQIIVNIGGSTFHPLEAPQVIEECFEQILATATAIEDPFEQAFFFMVQMPYLQPFDDVNKRVSRIGANIPLIRSNLAPLTFTDVPTDLYTHAMLGIYELNRIELLKDVFIWAYERSAARYKAVQQSLGEPNPFKLRYRSALRDLIGEIIRETMSREDAAENILSWARSVAPDDVDQFREVAETDLLNLHEGNFARYRVTPRQFQDWKRMWNSSS